MTNQLSTDKKKKEVVRLSWWILEQKLFYYNPQYGNCVDDTVYDKNELLYIKYCKELGLEPTASNNVGFPWDTGAGRLVASKYCKNLPPKPEFDGDANMKIVLDFENELEDFLEAIEKKKVRSRPRKRSS